ncbi:hypothetical protein QR98_0058180 [Sarcoptes scabiei]|uniref:SBF1/SBF2 domain-containing protein n=1 Tax=Sarcoptes scabiei TaxID=52283 RepID=A0A132A8U0_SARSC|nr:hypothetical protein QR98_0058180 [Sarcoptes scabiei]
METELLRSADSEFDPNLHHPHQRQDETTYSQRVRIKSRRSKKYRSIYGQPTKILSEESLSMQNQLYHFRSFDSLDLSDNYQSFESNSTSCSDLRSVTNDQRKVLSNQINITGGHSDLGSSVESFENEIETISLKRSCSVQSIANFSDCSHQEDECLSSKKHQQVEAKDFIRKFVEKIFKDCTSITLDEKAKFGNLAQTETARLWFARYINKKRIERKCVSESTFFSLAQYFALILFECAESDDFGPAKILMNMCFTYFHIPISLNGPYQDRTKQIQSRWSLLNRYCNSPQNHQNNSKKITEIHQEQYLYEILRDQPIWRQIRFWNAAFFDAVISERANFYENNRDPSNRFYDWQFHANLTFGQLG